MRRRRYPPPRRAGLIRLRIDNRPLSAAAGGGDAHPWLREGYLVLMHVSCITSVLGAGVARPWGD